MSKVVPHWLILCIGTLVVLAGSSFGSIANIYYGPVAAGSANGTNCANAYAYNDGTNGFSVAGKWGTGAGQIGWDGSIATVAHGCPGTYTLSAGGTPFTYQGSGVSGHQISLIFDQGAVLIQAPYLSNCINFNGNNFVFEDGLTNLVCQDTANGSPPVAITNITTSSGTCTASNATAPFGLTNGQKFTIVGNSVGAYNVSAATVLTQFDTSSSGQLTFSCTSSGTGTGGTLGIVCQDGVSQCANSHASSGIASSPGCVSCTIKNNTIRHLYVNAGQNANSTDINGAGTAGVSLQAGSVTNSVITGNTLTDLSIGVSIDFSNSDASGLVVCNNLISDMHWGIQFAAYSNAGTPTTAATPPILCNNDISFWDPWSNPVGTYHLDGIITYNCQSPETCFVDTISATPSPLTEQMYGNYIHGPWPPFSASVTGFIFCHHHLTCNIFNNLITNANGPGQIWIGQNAGPVTIEHNTITGPLNSTQGVAITLDTPSTGTFTIRNNVIQDLQLGIHDYGTLATDVGIADRNVYYFTVASPPTIQFATNDSGFLSLATWRGSGFDTHSVTTDPKVNLSTFALGASSSAIALGFNLFSGCSGQPNPGFGALCFDKAAVARPSSGNWDAGAYQYVSIPLNPGTTVAPGISGKGIVITDLHLPDVQ